MREPIPGDWRVLQENYPHVRDGMMAVWNIRVPCKWAIHTELSCPCGMTGPKRV